MLFLLALFSLAVSYSQYGPSSRRQNNVFSSYVAPRQFNNDAQRNQWLWSRTSNGYYNKQLRGTYRDAKNDQATKDAAYNTRREDVMARRAMGLNNRMRVADTVAGDHSRNKWNQESRELKNRYNDRSLSESDRRSAYNQRREEVMSRRYAGREGRRAMALGNSYGASDEQGAIAAINGIKRATGRNVDVAAGFSGQGYQDAPWRQVLFEPGAPP